MRHNGSVCAYNLAAPGSNPKRNIFAFSVYIVENYEIIEREKNKHKIAQNRPFGREPWSSGFGKRLIL